mgnify:CR=1 FL=1
MSSTPKTTNPSSGRPERFATLIALVLLGAATTGYFLGLTSPMTANGALIFGIGCGLITSVIRIWGGYPEGVSFSILFMNALTPLIDRTTIGKPFGYIRVKKEAA